VDNKVIGAVGAALLGFGAFLPVVRVPLRGSMTLMQVEWAGIGLIALAAIAAGLLLIDRMRHAIWPGIGALVLLGYAYFRVNMEIALSRQRLGQDIAEDPLRAVRDLAASSSRIEWGWAVPVLGALMVIAAGVLAWRSSRNRAGSGPAEQRER
jgi:hypothetical protein